MRSRSGVLAEKHLGWQGDYREQSVTSLPDRNQGCENKLVFAWKQGGKGLAFIASPYPMVWLAHLQRVVDPQSPMMAHARQGVWILRVRRSDIKRCDIIYAAMLPGGNR